MSEREYLTVAEVLAIHSVLVERYGGTPGVRDSAALESAVFRPQTGYYRDIVAEAAALFESLAINHPFIDGNKRSAFASVDVFLRLHGYRIVHPPMELYADMMRMFDSGTFDMAHIEPWLRGFVTTIEK